MRKIILLSLLATVAGCSAPQGKKLAATDMLAPVASGPLTGSASLSMADDSTYVNLKAEGTVTLRLPASLSSGNGWRFSEIPDQTVLKLVSRDFLSASNPREAGEETFVFQATGPGAVKVKMWYGNVSTASLATTRSYEFTVDVSEKEVPKAPTKKSKKS